MFRREVFFLVLLPPVVFEAGYTLHPGAYFGNMTAIATFAFLGSFMNTFIVGGLMYLCGSLGLSYAWDRFLRCYSVVNHVDGSVTVLSVFATSGAMDRI